MRKRASLFVSGLVQGVFYRASAASAAGKFGLVGTARNRTDGRVEITVEGEEEQIQMMIQWCREGPPSARVDDVEIQWAEPTGEDTEFRVR